MSGNFNEDQFFSWCVYRNLFDCNQRRNLLKYGFDADDSYWNSLIYRIRLALNNNEISSHQAAELNCVRRVRR